MGQLGEVRTGRGITMSLLETAAAAIRRAVQRPPGATSRSRLALPAAKQWDAGDRPAAWRDKEYGLVVHTTGGGLPAKARARGLYPTVLGVEVYNRSHGCHYLCGWRGLDGELLQLADDREQANGVGVRASEPESNQWLSVQRGPGAWARDLPVDIGVRWRRRWPGWSNPLDLLPGTETANAPYLHLELIPCVFHEDGELREAVAPMRPGLRFTRAQHDAVAALARDVADRKGWHVVGAAPPWWRTPRLLGHEDLTPLSRHDRSGGWDPGALRPLPYFDWGYVYEAIAAGYHLTDAGGLVMAERRLVRAEPGRFARF
jgi:hypothetical protein